MANQKTLEMLPIVRAKPLEQNKWSSKDFNEEITQGAITVLILIGGGKNSLHLKMKC
jgi:hypothetical protein